MIIITIITITRRRRRKERRRKEVIIHSFCNKYGKKTLSPELPTLKNQTEKKQKQKQKRKQKRRQKANNNRQTKQRKENACKGANKPSMQMQPPNYQNNVVLQAEEVISESQAGLGESDLDKLTTLYNGKVPLAEQHKGQTFCYKTLRKLSTLSAQCILSSHNFKRILLML